MATKSELPSSPPPPDDASSAPSTPRAAGTPAAGIPANRPESERFDDPTPLERVARAIPHGLTVDSALDAFIARASELAPTEWRTGTASARELELEERVAKLESELARTQSQSASRADLAAESTATLVVDPTTAVSVAPIGPDRHGRRWSRRWLPLLTFAAGIVLVLIILIIGQMVDRPGAAPPATGAADGLEAPGTSDVERSMTRGAAVESGDRERAGKTLQGEPAARRSPVPVPRAGKLDNDISPGETPRSREPRRRARRSSARSGAAAPPGPQDDAKPDGEAAAEREGDGDERGGIVDPFAE